MYKESIEEAHQSFKPTSGILNFNYQLSFFKTMKKCTDTNAQIPSMDEAN